jgi:hypothetical protein
MTTRPHVTQQETRMRPADRLARIIPPLPAATADEHRKLIDSTIGAALMLTGILRDQDPAEAAEFYAGLADDRRAMLPFVMAAMVDVDKTPRQLLGWANYLQPVRLDGATAMSPASVVLRANPRPTRSKECGTQGGWTDHRSAGEEPCDGCWIAHRAWDADRKARGRQRAGMSREMARAAQKRRRRHEVARQLGVQETLPMIGESINVA